jgi:hypothetical protein
VGISDGAASKGREVFLIESGLPNGGRNGIELPGQLAQTAVGGDTDCAGLLVQYPSGGDRVPSC